MTSINRVEVGTGTPSAPKGRAEFDSALAMRLNTRGPVGMLLSVPRSA